jgi:hypothetical protein
MPQRLKSAALVLVAVVALAALALMLWPAPDDDEAPSGDDVVAAAWSFYESRPHYQQPMPPTEVPQGLPDLRAETCGGCHAEIYQEWKISTHRRAWLDDAQFMAELDKSRGRHDPDSDDDLGWMCVNCHTPVFEQLDRIVVGLEDGDIGQPIYADNPRFDEKLQHEAITCATCHVRDGTVYGPFGDTDAPHPTAKDEGLLTEQTCTQCHQAEAEWPERNLGCYFTTGDEWAASTHGQTEQTCQSCHMPEVERKLAEAFDRPERTTRRHWFGGSLIAKHPDFKDELEPLQEIFGSGVDIELIRPQPGAEPAGTSDGEYDKGSTRCAPDEPCTRLWVRLTNANAGHKFPTGDPERHANVDIIVRDADGEIVAEARDRIASRFEWWPDLKKLTDNRIDPGDHHDIVVEVPGRTAELEVEIVAHKYRMYKEAFEHHELEGRYVRGRQFHESVWRVDASGEPSLVELTDDVDTIEPGTGEH